MLSNEESDYEDMMTPTDDEGITSLNHTQKIPISLIKAKDKASKLFQPIPQHHGNPTMASGASNRNVMAAKAGDGNYYFAHSYGSNN